MATHVMTKDGLAPIEGHRASKPGLLMRLEKITHKLLAGWAWYDKYRQTVRELNQLTDRELDDIGIPRRDIPTIAMNSANAAMDLR